MLDVKQWSTEWAGRTLTFEVGKLALQATAALTVQYGDTKVLATVVLSDSIRDGVDYFPLSVEFQEKLNAAGKIKGSRFIKLEGRPSDDAVLTGRLIDRSIRPLFDTSLRNDLQVVITPLSIDKDADTAVVGLIAASAVVAISPIAFDGPIAGARIGRDADGSLVLNPTLEQIAEHGMDIFVAGTPDKLVMVEAAASEIPESEMYTAMKWGCAALTPVIDLIATMVTALGTTKIEAAAAASELDTMKAIASAFLADNADSMMYDRARTGKKERNDMIAALADGLKAHLLEKGYEEDKMGKVLKEVKYLISEVVSKRILDKGQRLDGRKLDEVRELYGEVDLVPRVHGASLFMRGDTQVLNTIALGAPGDVQLLDTMQEDDTTKRYMHHYFDAPFTYGEAGFFRGPSRRAIGHGALAEKAILPVLPPVEEFPYTMRSVSEIMGSNGSSSMASTCASSLTLMAAGVPIKRAVAGIAMGLASESDVNGTITRYKVLTDLQDVEDGEGGMDFKITGTSEGITAIQMDTKTKGLTWEIVDQTMKQSADARKEILAMMATVIAAPRAELSPYAPRIVTLQINPEKIGDIIGPGGKTIKKIVEETGVDIDIEQDGRVLITSKDAAATERAIQIITDLTREIEAGEEFDGKVVRLEDFGAFVELLPGKDGLVHVSEMAWERTNKPSDLVKLGDIVKVKVKEIDNLGRVNLSMKVLVPKPAGYEERPPRDAARGPRPGGDRGPRNHGPRPDGGKPHGQHQGHARNSGARHATRPPHGDRPPHETPKPVTPTYTDNPANAGAKKDNGKKGLFGFKRG